MAEPPITVRAAHDSGHPNQPPTRYVVHATAGGRGYPAESAPGVARGTAEYFTRSATPGSAHYVHDAGGAEEHCVPEDTIAWHAPPNPRSIGDEICADPDYTRDEWLSDAVWPAVAASATRCRDVCDRYGIPKVKLTPADLLAGKSGICGHVDVSDAWHQSTHWDPGPDFPWDRYMAVVHGADEENDMTPDQAKALDEIHWMLTQIKPQTDRVHAVQADTDTLMWAVADPTQGLRAQVASLQGQVAALSTALGQVSGGAAVDMAAITAAADQAATKAAAAALGGLADRLKQAQAPATS